MARTTESDSNYNHLEKMSVIDLLTNINKEDNSVPKAIEKSITEIEKLNLLARFAQKEFFSHGSKISHAKLGRFILIAFLLHVSVVAFELIVPLNFKNPPTPPPIKVK